MKLVGIKETVIYVNDLPAIINFYQKSLGLILYSEKEGEHAFFKVGESMLLFFNPSHSRRKTSLPPHFAEGNQHFALTASQSDYGLWKSKIAETIGIEHIQKWGEELESFYFRDPENNSVEIVMQGIWT